MSATKQQLDRIAILRKQLERGVDKHTHKVIELTALRELERRLRFYCLDKSAELNRLLAEAGLPTEELLPPKNNH